MARPAQGGRGSEKLGCLLRADQHRRGGPRIPEAPAGSPRSLSTCSVIQGHTQGPHCGPRGSPRVLTVAPEDHQCPHCDPGGHPGSSLWPKRITQCPHCDPRDHPGPSRWPKRVTQGPQCGPRGSPSVHIVTPGVTQALTVAQEDHPVPTFDPGDHPGSSLWPQRVTQCPHLTPGVTQGLHGGPRGSARALTVAAEGHPGSSLWPQGITQCPHCDPGGHPGPSLWPQSVTQGPHCGPRGSPSVRI